MMPSLDLLHRLAVLSMPHLMLAPIMLPLLGAALMLLLREERWRTKVVLNLLFTLAGLACTLLLMLWAQRAGEPASVGVYLPGNWPAPYGIVLVLDRLSAMMLVLTYGLGVVAALYSSVRWHRVGVHFHPLFQLQLMGLSGAFLTADLFNLFVFFEIMLAASYGLLLHGSGRQRVQAGLHYIAINLAASSLFLLGISMLYGLTGTLNMADLALAIAGLQDVDRGMLHAGLGLLATAFLIKAAIWPLNFWLVPAYGSATAPVSALFAIMTKVGVYAIVRMWTLLLGSEAGASALFGGQWLVGAGLITMGFGAAGLLGSQRLAMMAGYAAILSSGTLLAAIGFGQNLLTSALLYYLPSSTLAVAALFLLADVIERWRAIGASYPAYGEDEAPFLTPELVPRTGINLDDDEEMLIGQAMPAALAFLGTAFVMCTLVIAGLPPLSGFLGKFALLTSLLNPMGLGASGGARAGVAGWLLFAALIVTGLMALIGLTRVGIRHFWSSIGRAAPRIGVLEGVPIGLLMLASVALTVHADAVMRYTQATATALHSPGTYVRAVLSATPKPGPTTPPAAPAPEAVPPSVAPPAPEKP